MYKHLEIHVKFDSEKKILLVRFTEGMDGLRVAGIIVTSLEGGSDV